jgi:hypothetical protein
MNYLKDHPQTRLYLTRPSCQNLIIIRFFLDFRARRGISNSFDGLLKAFLFQLALEIPELSPSIAEFGRIAMLQPEAQQELLWTTTKLRQALSSALRTCTTNIFILIDGVDELEGTGRNMLDMIEFFQELASIDNERRHIKICIASRPDPLLVAAFNASSGFKLQDYNDNGIKSYIDHRLKIATQYPNKPAYFEPSLVKFVEFIAKRSHGVFLWARFAIDEFLVGMAGGDEEKEIWARLQALPDELEEIYARIIKRTILNCGSSEETSIMLQIAYFTCRSLSLQEFYTVVQLYLGRLLSDSSFSYGAFENRLRAKTGGLVEVLGSEYTLNQRVKLVHETVRTYLDRLSGGPGIKFVETYGEQDPNLWELVIPEDKAKVEESRMPSSDARNLFQPNGSAASRPIPAVVNMTRGPSNFVGGKPKACVRCRILKIRVCTPTWSSSSANSGY